MKTPQAKLKHGYLHILVAFDVGFEIKISQVAPLFPHHKKNLVRYSFSSLNLGREQQPCCLEMDHLTLEIFNKTRIFAVSATFFDLGSISLELTAELTETLEDLPSLLKEVHTSEVVIQEIREMAQMIFNQVKPAVVRPSFFQTPAMYSVVNIQELDQPLTAEQIQNDLGPIISKVLRISDEPIGRLEIERTLSPFVTYSDQDVVFASSQAAFVFDETSSEVIDIFELANMQSLELKYIDAKLDMTLQSLYEENDESESTFFKKFLNIFDRQFKRLNTIHLDSTIVAERVEQSYKFAADSYLVDIHELAVKKMFLNSFGRAVDRKLEAIREVLSDLRSKVQSRRTESLEWIIIALIAVEFVSALLKNKS
jgi:hypothetical protein